MKNKSIYFIITILLSLVLFSACDEKTEGPVYEMNGKDYVSFLSKTQKIEVSNEAKVFVNLYHLNTSISGTTADFSVEFGESAKDLFSILSTQVTFTKDAAAPIEIDFDADNLEFNTNYTIKLTLKDDVPLSPLPSAVKSITVTIVKSLTFAELGEGVFVSEAFEEEWPQVVLLADQFQLYRCPDLYEKGKSIDFVVLEDGISVVVEPQPAWEYSPGDGDVYVRGEGTIENNIINVNLEHYLPGIRSFGTFMETLELP